MKPKPTPTSPKTREEHRALEELYGESSVAPPPRARIGLMIVLAALIGLLVAVAGVAGLASLSRRLPEDSWIRRFVPEARPTVVVRETDRTPNGPGLGEQRASLRSLVVSIYSGLPAAPASIADLPTPERFRGNAVFVASTGLALTTKEVVADAGGSLRALTSDGQLLAVTAVSLDPASPFAIITVAGDSFGSAKFAAEEDVTPGLPVVLVAPIGLPTGEFVSQTSIAALNQRTETGTTALIENSDFLDTVAALDQGAAPSGSIVANARGEVIGLTLTDRVAGHQAVAPIWHVLPALRLVLRGTDLVRTTVGLRYLDLSRLPRPSDAPAVDHGAWLTSADPQTPAVTPRSPAAKAGLRAGDVILEVQGTTLDQHTPLNALLQDASPGTTVRVRIRRGEDEQTLELTLGAARA